MIDGVHLKELTEFSNEQGSIQHMLRADDPLFSRFGEIYFSTTNPGVTKGWHVHVEQTSILSCISGTLTLALVDRREGSPTEGETMTVTFGDGQRKLVLIPPGVLYAWRNQTDTPAMLANCATHPHDPDKSRKVSLDEVPFP